MPDEATHLPVKPVLVLVPGLLCDEEIWSHQVAALESDYTVVIADVTGSSSIPDMARDVLAVAPPRFSLAGHSMGARVALQIVATEPERVERLALLDTGVHPRQVGEAARRQAMLELSAAEGMAALAEHWLPPMVAEGALAADPELKARLFAMVERMSPDIHRRQIAALLYRPDAQGQLAAIACPVLIGVGEQDRWSPPAQHEEIRDAIRQATYVVFPGSGHMAPMEVPEAVTAALRQWLAQPSTIEAGA